MMREVPVRWLSPRSAAAYLGVSYRTILQWVSDRTIPAARIARRNSRGCGRHIHTIRLDKERLDAFMQVKSK